MGKNPAFHYTLFELEATLHPGNPTATSGLSAGFHCSLFSYFIKKKKKKKEKKKKEKRFGTEKSNCKATVLNRRPCT